MCKEAGRFFLFTHDTGPPKKRKKDKEKGDCRAPSSFSRDMHFDTRAAGKNETEAGHARAKAEADIALSLPAEYRD